MGQADWVGLSEDYVTRLLTNELPNDMYFHNLQHTRLVVKAAREISVTCGLQKEDLAILQTAAWFHDAGYCYAYNGHEDKSIAMATTFLKKLNAGEDFIEKVSGCITATRMPQKPEELIQQILCDADLFHLSVKDYLKYADNLRREWQQKMAKFYLDREWRELNLNMLVTHRYFTIYGQTVLQKKKLKNIEELLTDIAK